MYKKRKPYDDVIESLRHSRSSVDPNPSFQEQLRLWYELRFKIYTNEVFKVRCKEYSDLRLRLWLGELKQ